MDSNWIGSLRNHDNDKNSFAKQNISDNSHKNNKERLLNRLDQIQQKILDF